MKVPTTYIFVATTVLLVAGVLAQDPIPSAAVTPSATTDSDVPNCTALALKIIPFCAQPCFIEAGSNLGCTGSDMIACQCRQADKLRSVVDGCVKSSCQPDEVQKVLDGSSKVCDCALNKPSTTISTSTTSTTTTTSSEATTTDDAETTVIETATTVVDPSASCTEHPGSDETESVTTVSVIFTPTITITDCSSACSPTSGALGVDSSTPPQHSQIHTTASQSHSPISSEVPGAGTQTRLAIDLVMFFAAVVALRIL